MPRWWSRCKRWRPCNCLCIPVKMINGMCWTQPCVVILLGRFDASMLSLCLIVCHGVGSIEYETFDNVRMYCRACHPFLAFMPNGHLTARSNFTNQFCENCPLFHQLLSCKSLSYDLLVWKRSCRHWSKQRKWPWGILEYRGHDSSSVRNSLQRCNVDAWILKFRVVGYADFS